MAGSVNKAIVVGNVGKDIEVRNTQQGAKIANITVATSESWIDKASGERKEKTEWHRVTIFNEKLAEIAEKYVVKGCKIYIEGALQTRKWTDNQGVERYTTEIVLANFNGKLEILTSPNRDNGASRGDDRGGDRQAAPRGGGGRQQSQERPVGQNGSRDPRYSSQAGGGRSSGPSWDSGGGVGGGDLDDEIPFGPEWR